VNPTAPQQRLDSLDADLDQWRDVLTLAAHCAANCQTAYRRASHAAKRQLNNAVFTRITLRDSHIDRWEFHPPFDVLFNTPQFEYGSLVELRGIEPLASSMRPRRSTN
jgi:hypothetical protein